jgi:hypothetical protein
MGWLTDGVTIIYGCANAAAVAELKASQQALDHFRQAHSARNAIEFDRLFGREQVDSTREFASIAGLSHAYAGPAALLRRRIHCIACGAPQEPVCSYCLTPEAP